jgi:hypothetical protein
MRGPLVLGLLGGGAAWIVHLSASYFLVALGCPRGWPALGVLLGVVTLAGVGGAVAAGMAARRGGRVGPARAVADEPDPGEPARFVAGVGVLLAGLFAFMILVAGVAPLILSPCVGA